MKLCDEDHPPPVPSQQLTAKDMAPRRKQAQINEQPTQQQGTEPDQGPPLPAEGDYPPVPDETFAGAPTGERIIPVWAKIISGSQLAAFLVLLGYLWLLAIDPAAGKSLGKRARLPAPLERIAVTDWARVLPPHATNLSHAWELGIAEGTLASSLENGLSKKVVEAAAAQAVNLLVGSGFGANFSSDTEKEPAKVLDAIRQAKMTTMATENKKGLVSFVKNAFSLANALWLIGILGVTASISPVLVFALPSVVGFLMRFWMMAWQYLRPIWWLTWRPVLYYFAAGAFSSAGNTEISLDVRVYSLLTVAIFCGAAAAYTMMILSLLDMVTKDAAESLVFAFACGLLVPLAHILSSKLLGFLAVLCFFSACGMGMRAFPGGYVIGFTSRSALDRSVVVSLAIVSFSVLVRLSGSDKLESLFAPFSSVGGRGSDVIS